MSAHQYLIQHEILPEGILRSLLEASNLLIRPLPIMGGAQG